MTRSLISVKPVRRLRLATLPTHRPTRFKSASRDADPKCIRKGPRSWITVVVDATSATCSLDRLSTIKITCYVRVDHSQTTGLSKNPGNREGSRPAAGRGATPRFREVPPPARRQRGISARKSERKSRSIVVCRVGARVGSRLGIPTIGRDGADARLGPCGTGLVFQENS